MPLRRKQRARMHACIHNSNRTHPFVVDRDAAVHIADKIGRLVIGGKHKDVRQIESTRFRTADKIQELDLSEITNHDNHRLGGSSQFLQDGLQFSGDLIQCFQVMRQHLPIVFGILEFGRIELFLAIVLMSPQDLSEGRRGRHAITFVVDAQPFLNVIRFVLRHDRQTLAAGAAVIAQDQIHLLTILDGLFHAELWQIFILKEIDDGCRLFSSFVVAIDKTTTRLVSETSVLEG